MRSSLVFTILLAGAAAQLSASSICDSTPGNLVQNCGFETGALSPWTEVGNWTTPYNGVIGGGNSGSFQLEDGNFEFQGLAGVTQTISDTAGEIYQFSFYLLQTGVNNGFDSGQPQQAFVASWDGANVLNEGDVSVLTYTQYSYDVVGTGSDTIQFQGYEDSGYNHLDDVVVTDTGVSSTPEPGTLGLLGGPALLALAAILRRRK